MLHQQLDHRGYVVLLSLREPGPPRAELVSVFDLPTHLFVYSIYGMLSSLLGRPGASQNAESGRRYASCRIRGHSIGRAARSVWATTSSARATLPTLIRRSSPYLRSSNRSMIGATRPEVQRDKAGYVLDARGNVVTEHGQPTRRATHLKAVHTGRRESNPSAIQYPVLSPDDLVRMCYPDVAMSASGRRVQALRARETLETMQGDGVVTLVEAEDGSGKRGVRVPVADAHRERHEALRAVRERRRRRRSTGNADRALQTPPSWTCA